MNWKEHEKKLSWPNLRHFPGFCLKLLKKITKHSEYPVFGSRLELGTSRIRSMCVNLITLKFSVYMHRTIGLQPKEERTLLPQLPDNIHSRSMLCISVQMMLGPCFWMGLSFIFRLSINVWSWNEIRFCKLLIIQAISPGFYNGQKKE
jgi:hypothetical protein